MNDQEKMRELQQKAAAYQQSKAFPKVHDNVKVTTNDQGEYVVLGRRHDDHTQWDVIAK